MNPIGESRNSNRLFKEETPVWYGLNGKVSRKWLSACKEERNQTQGLMEKIVSPLNLQEACRRVVSNGGSSGSDKMETEELKNWLGENLSKLQEELLTGSYVPQPVKGVRIPKPKGGYRQLGIPTVKDRLVQQAISQVLSVIYERTFSENSFGFRPSRNAHQALKMAASYVKEGQESLVNIDLAKFFDEVNHHRLLWLLGTRLGDKRVIRLIHQFLRTGIMEGGVTSVRIKGTPQGSPLSPLLSNIVLDELDQELTRRGYSFVRYADDLQIFCNNQRRGEQIKESVTHFLEGRMKLKVNREKSGVRQYWQSNFLGHSILKEGKVGLSKQSEERLRTKLKSITKRNRGNSLQAILKELKLILRGWLEYFKHASMKSKLDKLDGWLRRKLKCYRLKQCKRTIGIVRLLRSLGVEEKLCWKTALSGKGWWRLSNSPGISTGMTNKWFKEQGYYDLSENYKRLQCKLL